MPARACLALLPWLALIVSVPCGAAPSSPTSVAVAWLRADDLDQRTQLVDSAIIETLTSRRLAALPPAKVAAGLRSPALRRARKRAASLLAEATLLGKEVRYDEALRKLESAETAALEGLARLTEPKLLAEIYYQRGIALLPTDQVAAHRHLVDSLLIWPARPVAAWTSPKISLALRQAAKRAAVSPVTAPSLSEAARATRALGARFLLAAALRRTRDKEIVSLFIYDQDQEAFRPARAEWEAGAAKSTMRSALERTLGELLPAASALPRALSSPATSAATHPVEPTVRRPSRRVLPWVVTGVGGALLVSGTALLLVARSRSQEFEQLSQRSPPLEYEPAAREVEESGRRFNTAGIVCLSLAGAAAVGAVVLWLLSPRAEPPARHPAAAPGTLRLSLDFP